MVAEPEAEELDANVRARGAQLTTGLRALQAELPEVIKDVRGHGLMLGVEVHTGVGALEAEGVEAKDAAHVALEVAKGRAGVGAHARHVEELDRAILDRARLVEHLGAAADEIARHAREHAGVARVGEQVHQRREAAEVRVLRARVRLAAGRHLPQGGRRAARRVGRHDALEEVEDVERQSHVRDGAHLPLLHAVLRGDGREPVRARRE